MEPDRQDNHGVYLQQFLKAKHSQDQGLPYPLESTISAPPFERAEEQYQPRLGEPVKLEHIAKLEDPFAALKFFNTLLLIDDSESMQQCWDEVGDIIRKITPTCIEYDPNGIDIEFVNHRASGYYITGRSGYAHIGLVKGRLDMHDSVAGIYHNVKPKGKCRMDTRLASILDPYVNEYETQVRRSGGKRRPAPLNIIVISDLEWDSREDGFGTIIRTARKLDILRAPPYQVGIQLFRVGDAAREMSDAAVRYADDLVWREEGVRDMVDLTTWTGKPGELSSEGTLKVLLGAVRRSIDFMEV
ncbi:hypothetical protein F5Y19DRAFT_488663 [Xylariaceae sp. FL1651]|nr:hypothetical protein F5Y19DRAFT_488663 [Xylariaceae sp. FL1651]